jgi:excisionase family DNA binding protein
LPLRIALEALMVQSERTELWPALMTLERACCYLSLEPAPFLALAKRWAVYPVETGEDVILWRRKDLDLLVRRLPTSGQWLGNSMPPKPVNFSAATIDSIAEAVVCRLATLQSLSPAKQPKLVSIKDAAFQLGLGRSTIYKMINSGSLTVQRIGSRALVTQESIARHIGG